jgi:hypothetical protein
VAIEHADHFVRAGKAILLGTDLVVDIRTQPVEVILAVVLGYVRPYLQSLRVLEEYDGTFDRSAGRILHDTLDDAGIRRDVVFARCRNAGCGHLRLTHRSHLQERSGKEHRKPGSQIPQETDHAITHERKAERAVALAPVLLFLFFILIVVFVVVLIVVEIEVIIVAVAFVVSF